jgi:hypothetical protein
VNGGSVSPAPLSQEARPDRLREDERGSGTYARILSAWKPILDVQLAVMTRDVIEKALADRKAAGKKAGTLIRDWMVGAFGEVLVLDWGLAKVLDGGEFSPARRTSALTGRRSEH